MMVAQISLLGGLHQLSNRFCCALSILEYGLPAQNGLTDFPCQLASTIRTLPVTITQVLGPHRKASSQVHQAKIGIRPQHQLAFGREQSKAFGYVERNKPGQ